MDGVGKPQNGRRAVKSGCEGGNTEHRVSACAVRPEVLHMHRRFAARNTCQANRAARERAKYRQTCKQSARARRFQSSFHLAARRRASISSILKRVETTDDLRSSGQCFVYVVQTIVPSGSSSTPEYPVSNFDHPYSFEG